jgi:uncharacterized protein YaeQ
MVDDDEEPSMEKWERDEVGALLEWVVLGKWAHQVLKKVSIECYYMMVHNHPSWHHHIYTQLYSSVFYL